MKAINKDTIGVEVSLCVHPEDTPIRGNAIASGDEDFDREIEDKLTERLENGDELAWFCAEVRVDFGPLRESEYLGCCSYASLESFKEDGYYAHMVEECIAGINKQIGKLERMLAS